MRLKNILALSIISFSGYCLASPFLVCDPFPQDQQVTTFTGLMDAKAFTTPYALHPTGAAIIYDLGTLDDGAHKFTEIRANNIRGQSGPIPFDLPALPQSLSHTRMIQ